MRDSVVIERDFNVPVERVFNALIRPEDLIQWHHAGGGWKTPHAEVDPKVGGKIRIGYSNADGTQTFEFVATISEYDPPKRFAYYLQVEDLVSNDNRQVTYDLTENEGVTHLRLEFDIEHENTRELQQRGWAEHIDNLETMFRQ